MFVVVLTQCSVLKLGWEIEGIGCVSNSEGDNWEIDGIWLGVGVIGTMVTSIMR